MPLISLSREVVGFNNRAGIFGSFNNWGLLKLKVGMVHGKYQNCYYKYILTFSLVGTPTNKTHEPTKIWGISPRKQKKGYP